MKTPEEYLIGCEHDGSYIPVNEVLRIIKQVQKETWNEALDKAAESADVIDLGIEGNAVVDLNSILKLKL